MFYKLIEKKRNEWLASDECTIKELLQYIVQRGMMRATSVAALRRWRVQRHKYWASGTDRDGP